MKNEQAAVLAIERLQADRSAPGRTDSVAVWVRVVAAICAILFAGWALMIVLMYMERRDSAIEQARGVAASANQMIVAGLTGMMITGVSKEQRVFLDQVRNSDEIKSVKVFRSGSTVEQYGPGDADHDRPGVDEQSAMMRGKPYFAFNEREGFLQAVFPMLNASSYLGKNCMECHRGRADEVLGAVSLRVSLTAMQQQLRSFLWQTALEAAIVSLPLLFAIYWVIRRYVSKPLGGEPGEATAVANRIAEGDLSAPIPVAPDDHTSLLSAMARMQRHLGRIVGQIHESAGTIATASTQIAAGNADLSGRTEEQATALEETASSMEELTSNVRQNGENARQANQLAAGASQVAVRGGEVVGKVVSTMSSINQSSKRIADIIGVIDGIAFQTNILALNAAVEAARAGAQGRGFAVVAAEVRSLAQRSAAAAKEIKDLITDSVAKVEVGTQQVDEAGHTIAELVASVKRVSEVMSEITKASREQEAGISQVNQAVMQMDQVTQHNAALVEEAAAAADAMQRQAEQLAGAVAVFKLAKSYPSPSAPASTATAPRSAAPVTASKAPAGPAKRRLPRAAGTAGAREDEWTEF